MKTTLLLSVLLATAALAGCTSGSDDDTQDNMTTSPTTTASPAATPAATPATTPTAGNGTDGGMPPMMECEGDYTTNATGALYGMPELVFTAKDPDAQDPCYAFVGPQTASPGWTAITVDYPAGREFHIMPMYFIGERTQEDVLQAFAAEGSPEWAVAVGAVGGVTPGQSGSVALELEEGNYVYFCPINGHMFQGMMGMLQVEGNATDAVEPTATVSIDLVDYNFTVPSSIPANTTVIKVTNRGSEDHEAPLVLLDANTTAMQFLMALEDPNATAPPPGALVGGANTIAPSRTIYLLPALEAGRTYAMACFVESEKHGGAAHVELGMIKEFTAA